MLIDARQQFEKAPKSFGNKRHRINHTHRAWKYFYRYQIASDLRRTFPDMRGFSSLSGTGCSRNERISRRNSGTRRSRNGGNCRPVPRSRPVCARISLTHTLRAPHRDHEEDQGPAARFWYLRATASFGWSRNVLLNQIKAGAYERAVTEKKTHNFDQSLIHECVTGQRRITEAEVARCQSPAHRTVEL